MWKPKVHYHIHISPRPIHLNSAHTFLSWFFNIILPFTLTSFKRSRFAFWLEFLCIISDGFHARFISHHSYASRLDHLKALDYFCFVYLLKIRLQIMKILFTQLSHASPNFLLLSYKCSVQQRTIKYSQSVFSLYNDVSSSTPYTTDSIVSEIHYVALYWLGTRTVFLWHSTPITPVPFTYYNYHSPSAASKSFTCQVKCHAVPVLCCP
jgi:hypothetical protein